MNPRFRFLFVGQYSWTAAVFFSGILLDKVYSNYLKGVLGSSASAMVFSEISDILLCIGIVMVISAIGAVAFSWNSKIAKNLFIASLVAFSLELLIPIFSSLIKNTQNLGWIRLFPSGMASILAFIGLYKYYRQ